MISIERVQVKTKGFGDAHDITERVREAVRRARVVRGDVLVFVLGSTAGITTIEFEEGALADLKTAFERVAPEGADYLHNEKWGDGNGFSHVRAAFLKPDLTIPVFGGELLLGKWQQVVLLDFDNRRRSREVVVQVRGEPAESA